MGSVHTDNPQGLQTAPYSSVARPQWPILALKFYHYRYITDTYGYMASICWMRLGEAMEIGWGCVRLDDVWRLWERLELMKCDGEEERVHVNFIKAGRVLFCMVGSGCNWLRLWKAIYFSNYVVIINCRSFWQRPC
jgi:hypothetical protein